MKIKIIIIFTFFLFGLGSCATGIENKKLIYREHSTAYFSIQLNQLDSQNRKLIQTPLLHPISEYTPETWKAILGNLEYIQTSSVGKSKNYAFVEEDLDNIAFNIYQSLQKIDNQSILVLIAKQNETKGVVSNDVRNTMVVFRNSEGIHIYFREIQSLMHGIDFNNYYEWSVVPDLILYANYDKIQLAEDTYYTFKTINGFENRLWAVINESNLSHLTYQPRTPKPIEVTNSNKEPKNKDNTPPKSEIYIRRDLDLD